MFRGTLVRKAGASKSASRDDGSGDVMDERLKNIEQKMVELIMSEVWIICCKVLNVFLLWYNLMFSFQIMDHGPPTTWDDIAGLEFAKKTIKEIVVWPMLRPSV